MNRVCTTPTCMLARKKGYKVSAIPTQEELKRWLFEEKGIAISTVWQNGWVYNIRSIENTYCERETVEFNSRVFNKEEGALENALYEALTYHLK